MHSLEYYIKEECRCVDDVIEIGSIYRTIMSDPDKYTEEYKEKWTNSMKAAEINLDLARMNLKSYIEEILN